MRYTCQVEPTDAIELHEGSNGEIMFTTTTADGYLKTATIFVSQEDAAKLRDEINQMLHTAESYMLQTLQLVRQINQGDKYRAKFEYISDPDLVYISVTPLPNLKYKRIYTYRLNSKNSAEQAKEVLEALTELIEAEA